jgi:G:T-mismatch repair DNA endonuclease (very short patch repair protein)
MMSTYDDVKDRLLQLVVRAKDQRVRPHELEKMVESEFQLSRYTVSEALKDLVREGELVFTYRDPCSYVEFPCNGCIGHHHAARPMKVIPDNRGEYWICDRVADRDADLRAQGCWPCGELAFTPSG